MKKKINNYKLFLDLDLESPINEEVGLRNLKKIAKGLDTMQQALVGTKGLEKIPKEAATTRDISNLVEGGRQCEIYFHKDLDGLTSALAMKNLLKSQYNIETVECHITQYGGLEFAVLPPKPGNMAVLVDFAHSKPMFTIATDHHQEQVGAEDTSSTYYKHSRSNVETISGEISKQELFNQDDIDFIKIIDSADFLRNGITPDDVQQSIFELDKSQPIKKIKYTMGFVVNRLLLAHKNKRITVQSKDGKRNHINRNLLECLLLDSSPNLYSIFNNLSHYILNAKTSDKLGRLATPEEVAKNLADYIERMKTYKDKTFDDDYKIIQQYGGGDMMKPGSYDRYVAFKNTPESEFICIIWPMGLIQVSCNPYKEKKLEDINLGEITKEVLVKYESVFKRYFISLEAIKQVYETSQDWKSMQKALGESYVGVGFRFSDLEAFYVDCIYNKKDEKVSNILNKVAEIDFVAVDEDYQKIKVLITIGENTYAFSIRETEKIEGIIEASVLGNVEEYSNSILTQKIQKFESPIALKQLNGAKDSITNLLRRGDLIISKRDKISIFSDESGMLQELRSAMDTTYDKMTQRQKNYLSDLKIPVWELITRNSGGHPSITNIAGLNFLAYNKRVMKIAYKTEKYTDLLKMIAKDFIDNLKEKIDKVNAGELITYNTAGIELYGQDTNESFEYQLVDKDSGMAKPVSKEEFIKAGAEKGMRTDRKSLMTIDTENRRVIAKFEQFNNSKR
jgi:hypothetical protein